MIGIVCSASFGDCMFNTALCRAVAEKHGPVVAATQPKYQDAYRNLPYIAHICEPHQIGSMGCDRVVDCTPYLHFDALHRDNNRFSLVDTHKVVWEREFGPIEYDPRPDFRLTAEEAATVQAYSDKQGLVAIESVAFSGQSWADKRALDMILARHLNDRVLWLSNQDAPSLSNVDNLLRYSRREVIGLIELCAVFYTTGSGFFCSSLALPRRPSRTVCLWRDHYYRYEEKFEQLGWEVQWVHDHSELTTALDPSWTKSLP